MINSLGSGALVVAILSAVICYLLTRNRSTKIKLMACLGLPFLIASVVYRLPAGSDSAEYEAWELLFIVPWYLAGAISSVIFLIIMESIQNKKKKTD